MSDEELRDFFVGHMLGGLTAKYGTYLSQDQIETIYLIAGAAVQEKYKQKQEQTND